MGLVSAPCWRGVSSRKPTILHSPRFDECPGRLAGQEEEHEVVGAAREAAMKELARDDPDILKRTIGPELEKVPRKKHRPPPIPAVPFRPPPPEYYNRRAQAMISVAEQVQRM